MDILIAVFGSIILGIVAPATCAFWQEYDAPKEWVSGGCFITLALVAILIWDYKAINTHEATNYYNISCPIFVKYNSPYWIDEKGAPHALEGDYKFVDPDTHEMVVKIIPGGWSMGIYVTETRSVKLQKKTLAEAIPATK